MSLKTKTIYYILLNFYFINCVKNYDKTINFCNKTEQVSKPISKTSLNRIQQENIKYQEPDKIDFSIIDKNKQLDLFNFCIIEEKEKQKEYNFIVKSWVKENREFLKKSLEIYYKKTNNKNLETKNKQNLFIKWLLKEINKTKKRKETLKKSIHQADQMKYNLYYKDSLLRFNLYRLSIRKLTRLYNEKKRLDFKINFI